MTTQKNKIAELERFLAKEKEQHAEALKKIQNQKKKGNMLPTEEIVSTNKKHLIHSFVKNCIWFLRYHWLQS